MKGISENVIRNFLKENLSVLESGLSLVQDEFYMRGREGSGGYIDILAKDKYGHYVFIELKRAESSAREALHEVTKYLQLSNLAAHECRVFIVSTSWGELSSSLPLFQKEMEYPIEGYLLVVDEDGVPLSSTKFDPRIVKVYRLEYHKEHLQVVYDQLDKARNAFVKLKKHVDQFAVPVAVAIFVNPNEFEEVKARLYLAAIRDWDDATVFEAEKLIERTGINAGRKAMDGPRNVYEDYLRALTCVLGRDFLELDRGTPNKLATYNSIWGVDEVCFSNELLRHFPIHSPTDFIESASLKKTGGKDWLDVVFSTRHAPSYKKNIENIESFIRHRPSWHDFILGSISALESDRDGIEVDLQIFDPRNVVASLVGFHETQDESYLPRYSLTVRDLDGSDLISVMGSYVWNGAVIKSSPEELFSSLGVTYITHLAFGYAGSVDTDICDALGLSYATFQVFPESVLYTEKGACEDFDGFYKAHVEWIEEITADVALFNYN
ncbi:Endonuclease NucS [Pseudomonas sp. Bi123]|uniref:endonuclease NucS domain-containing protein n=1 Tax=Pseudomonas TaxID=286 RepID=UPI001DC37EC9|nr:endonuclease NucS domain-containing protein [Pseudomonas sp. Bi123]CAH0185601.1 Endonuclease NucS [Pseudomonas sp. Bi123]